MLLSSNNTIMAKTSNLKFLNILRINNFRPLETKIEINWRRFCRFLSVVSELNVIFVYCVVSREYESGLKCSPD